MDAIQTLVANLQQTKYSNFNAEIRCLYDNFIAALLEIEGGIGPSADAILVESGSSSKISAFPNAAALTGTELAVIVQGGANVQTTTQAIANLGSASGANPTATAGPVAVNGSATTFMRSDGAPAIQKASNAQFGLVEGDGTTITIVAGVASVVTPAPVAANPTGTAGPAAVNGVATTFMRSDAAPAVQKCSNSQFGLAEPDNDTIQSTTAGVIRSKRNDVSFNFSGVPGASQKFTYIANRAWSLPASLTGSQAVIGTNPTGTLTVTLNKNGSSIGSIVFSTGGVPTFTFASPVNFAIGDILTAVCPVSPDATGADIAASLQGSLT